MENFCNEKFLQKCKDGFKGSNSSTASEISKVCRCDLDQGTYNMPDFQVPVKLSKKRERLSSQIRGVNFF